MSAKQAQLSEVLELLKKVQVVVQDDLEDSAIEQLNEAIALLEDAVQNSGHKLSQEDLLFYLGRGISLLPPIVKLITFIRDEIVD